MDSATSFDSIVVIANSIKFIHAYLDHKTHTGMVNGTIKHSSLGVTMLV